MVIRICRFCGNKFEALCREQYCSPECRTAGTKKRLKEYRERPENRIRAHERYKENFVAERHDNRSNVSDPTEDRKLFEETAHLAKGIHTCSKVQHMTADQLIRAFKEGLRIATKVASSK